jgi:hypothetical protein
VSNSGNDNNNGLSPSTPWATIAKIQSFQASFVPDDHINFQAGGLWLEMLSLTSFQGSSGHPIVITTYGSGARPIIDGSSTRTTCINAISGTHKFFTIDGFECRNTIQYGITCQGGAGSCQGYTVQNNFIHNTGPGAFASNTTVGPDTHGYCAAVGAGSGTDCNGNSITGTITAGGCDDCNYRNQLDAEDFGAGVGVDGIRFINNIVNNCGGHNCLQVHYDAGSPLVQSNAVGPGCVHNCIDVKGAVGGLVTQNIATTGNTANLANNPACYYAENTFTASSSISFTKNVCYGSEFGLQVSTGGSCVGHVHCTQAVTAYNNTMYMPNTTAEALYSSDSSGNMADITLTAENDIWDGGNVFVNTAINRLDDYNDRGGVQGQQSNNMIVGPHSVANINPSYVNATSHNFQLNANSPVATSGNIALTGINSIGAFQAPPSGLPANVPTPAPIPTPAPPTIAVVTVFPGYSGVASIVGNATQNGTSGAISGTDDSTSFQTIANSHDLIVQAGNYRISHWIDLPSNRVIQCQPNAFFYMDDVAQHVLSIGWFGGSPTNVTVNGCGFRGTNVPTGGNNYGAVNLAVANFMVAVGGNGNGQATNINLQNNNFANSQTDCINIFDNCGSSNPGSGSCGGKTPGADNEGPDRIYIQGNSFNRASGGPAIHINGGHHVYVYNNTGTDVNFAQEEDPSTLQVIRGLYFYHNTLSVDTWGQAQSVTSNNGGFLTCLGDSAAPGNGSGCWAVQNTIGGCASSGSQPCIQLAIGSPNVSVSGNSTGNYYGNILQNGAIYTPNSSPQNQQLTTPYCDSGSCSITGWLNVPPTPN